MDDYDSTRVIDLEHLQAVAEDFSDATAMGVITVDYRGVPVTPACGFSAFCLEVRKDPIRRMRCYSCDAHGGLEAAIEGRPRIYHCHTGLVDFSVPIIVGDQYVGAILCGQIKLDSRFGDVDSLLGQDQSWRKDDHLKDLYDEIPTTTIQRVESASKILSSLGQSMVRKAGTLVPLSGIDTDLRSALSGAKPAAEGVEPEPAGLVPVGELAQTTVVLPPRTSTPESEIVRLRQAVENEDLPVAVAALNGYLDHLFTNSERFISKDRLIPVEDEMIRLATGISQVTGDNVRETVQRYRARQASHPNRYICQTYLESLLAVILRGLGTTNPSRKHTMASLVNHLECNPARAWTLKEAAAYLGMSVSHTSKRFKAYTGLNFVEYVSQKRIERAKLMLAYTDLPVVRIAREVNFLPNYFSRVFKSTTGLTPTAYREQYGRRLD